MVVLDPAGWVLLLRYDDPPPNGVHWNVPGGGLEPGESPAQGAARELVEETGWTDVALGPRLGTHDRVLEHGRLVHQHETLYAARVAVPRRPLTGVAAMHAADLITGWRWWSPAELAGTTELVWPRGLADLAARAHGLV